jgi:cell division protein FtsB
MGRDDFAFGLTAVSAACWIVCFWWMHRISSRQDALLAELHAQTCRIEQLSKTEHDLIREVHPQVGEIKEAVEGVASKLIEGAAHLPSSATQDKSRR